jgi:octaprenyl-diphosphate synthase
LARRSCGWLLAKPLKHERKPLVTRLAPPPAALDALYSPIQAELAQAEQVFRDQLRSEHAFVDELVSYGCLLGGKRLRPALLLLAGKVAGRVKREHYTLAAVVEMIHTATLVHDDVLDEAETRRHLATVNARWDNEAAVLLGDFLFTHAFYLASTTGSTTACRLIGQATNRVCEGEIKQKGSRGNLHLTEREYFEIIDGKTAALTQCSCQLGAIFAGAADDVSERLARYGCHLGIAFQIADDLLDIVGEPGVVGKTLGTDLVKQKPTLPLIRTLSLCSDEERQSLAEALFTPGDNQIARLLPLFERYDALEYARQTALEHAAEARRQLDNLLPSPALDTLVAMADFVVQRAS